MSAAVRAWAAMVAGVEGARAPEAGPCRVEVVGRARWPQGPERLARMDRPALHALLVARHVVEAAGLAPADDVGVIVGTALGCAEVNARFHRGLVELGPEGASPRLFAQTLPSTPAGEAAIAFGLRGHSATLMAGRASGVAAVAEALRALRSGRLRAALLIAGDTFGPDELTLRAARGEAAPCEATVALCLTRAEDAPADAPRVTDARVRFDPAARAAQGTDFLAASGLLELIRWLEGVDERFSVEVACGSGRVGELSARRGVGC